MTQIGVIPGRFNPCTRGHSKLFKKALSENKNGAYVVLIKGMESRKDKTKNPLDADTQEKLILNLVPDINVMESDAGNLPEIIYEILEPTQSLYLGSQEYTFTFYCGTDRYTAYKQQAENPEYIRDVIDELDEQGITIDTIDVKVVLTEREEGKPLDESKINYDNPPTEEEIKSYSATAARQAAITDNDRLAIRIMGLEDNESLYLKVKNQIVKGAKQTAVAEKINSIMEKIL